MSLVIKFYYTSSTLNMFQELATFLLYHHIGYVFLFRYVWLGVVSV